MSALTVVVGTGYTGTRLLAALPAADATGIGRSKPRDESGAACFVFDLDKDADLPIDLPEHYDVVYTVPPAARTSDNGSRPDPRLASLLAKLVPAPERFVYISSSAVYGDRDGNRVAETSEPDPQSPRARRRLAAEQLLDDWCDENGIDLVTLRTPGIYGPGRLGIERIRAAAPLLNEADAHPGNRIHVDDLVRCCIAALADSAPPGIYNVGDGDYRSSTWFSKEVARRCDLPIPPTVSRAQAEREFSARRLSFLSESRRLDTSKMRGILGVRPRYGNAEDGIKASLEE